MRIKFQKLALGLASVALGLGLLSCSQDNEQVTNRDNEYITVQLDTENGINEAEELRTVQFTHGASGKPTFKFTTDGSSEGKRKVWTTITKKGATDNERVEIFKSQLEWDIVNDGRTLRYTGELKILSSLYTGAEDLKIHAVTGSTDFTRDGENPRLVEYKARDSQDHNVTDLEVPYVMTAPVEKKLDAQKRETKVLIISDKSQARFKPKGVLAVFTMENKLDIAVRANYIFMKTSRYQQTVKLNHYGEYVDPNAQVSPTTVSKNGVAGILFANTPLHLPPGEIRRHIAWLPLDDVKAIQEVRIVSQTNPGVFTRDENTTVSEGKYLHYVCSYEEVAQPAFFKGQFAVDNFGNILEEQKSGYNNAFTQEEVQNWSNQDIGHFLLYYLPPYGNLLTYAGRDEMNEEISYDEAQRHNINTFHKFVSGGPVLRLGVKWRYLRETTSGLPTIYAARFLGSEEYRILQRVRYSPQDRIGTDKFYSHGYEEVSFLPYDEAAVESGTALTDEYWAEHEKEVWTVRFNAIQLQLYAGPHHYEVGRPILLLHEGTSQIGLPFNTYYSVGRPGGGARGDMFDASSFGAVFRIPKLRTK